MEQLTCSLPYCDWEARNCDWWLHGEAIGAKQLRTVVVNGNGWKWALCWSAEWCIRKMHGARLDDDDSPWSPRHLPLISWSKSGGYHISNPEIVLLHGETVGIGTKPCAPCSLALLGSSDDWHIKEICTGTHSDELQELLRSFLRTVDSSTGILFGTFSPKHSRNFKIIPKKRLETSK